MKKYRYEFYATATLKPTAIWDQTDSIPGRLVADLENATHEEATVMFEALKRFAETGLRIQN